MALPRTCPASRNVTATPGAIVCRLAVGQADHLRQRLRHVLLPVERLDRLEVRLAPFDQPGDVARVRLLNHRRVEQHRRRQIARRGRRVHRPVDSRSGTAAAARPSGRCARARARPRPASVDVDGDVAVLLERLAAPALKQAAVEQHRGAGRAQEVLRSGDGLRRADELERDHGPELSVLGGVRDFAKAGVVGSGCVGSFACSQARAVDGSSAKENRSQILARRSSRGGPSPRSRSPRSSSASRKGGSGCRARACASGSA